MDPEYRKCYTEIFNGNWEVINKGGVKRGE